MSKKKKSGNQDLLVKSIILATAALNLIKSVVDLIMKLHE